MYKGWFSVLHNTELEFDFSEVLATNEVVGLLAIGCFFIGTKSFSAHLAKSEIDVSDVCADNRAHHQLFVYVFATQTWKFNLVSVQGVR